MKKLKLHPEELRVESFASTHGGELPRVGTVRGAAVYTRYGDATCEPLFTCPECADLETWDCSGACEFTAHGNDTCRPYHTCPECAAD